MEWYPVEEDGTLGPVEGQFLEGLPLATFLDFQHLVIPIDDRALRLITSRRSIYLNPGADRGEVVVFQAASPEIPDGFTVERAFRVGGEIYVVWMGQTNATYRAGLGVLGEDDAVDALGPPFYEGDDPQGVVGIQLEGGYEGHFLIDHPDGDRVLEIDRAGQVVDHHAIATPGRYYLHWVAIGTAPPLWSGLHGQRWCIFTLDDRSGFDCAPLSERDVGGVTTISTQYRDTRGVLWAATAARDGVVVRRYENDRFAPEVFTPVQIGYCDILLYLR